jgi:Coiled-coil domain-containing protein 124 /Oxs1
MAGLKSVKSSSAAGKSRGAAGKSAAAPPKRGLDLAQLESSAGAASPGSPRSERSDPMSLSATLNASGIDNALDALSLATDTGGGAVERHPERRFRGAYAAFEARRLEEMRDDKSLRRQQKVDLVRKEFEKSPENPFNQVSVRFNATREQIAEVKGQEKERIETRLGSPTTELSSFE